MDLLQTFKKKEILRSKIQCSNQLNIWLDHCEYAIHSEFNKNNKDLYKFKKRKKQIDPNFKNAIFNLNREEKVQIYLRMVNHLQNISKGIMNLPQTNETKQESVQGKCQCRSFNLKIWKQKNIIMNRTLHQIMVQNSKDLKIKTYDLRNYLLRKSKIKDKNVLVLEAINDRPHEKSRTVHIAFQDAQTLKQWFNFIKQQIEICEWLNIKEMYKTNRYNQDSQKGQSSTSQQSIASKKNLQFLKIQEQLNNQQLKILGNRKTIIQHLISDDCTDFQEFYDIVDNETENDIKLKRNLDFFHKIMPEYQLQDLTQMAGYQTIVNQNNQFSIFKSLYDQSKYKIQIKFTNSAFNAKLVFSLISDPKNSLLINENYGEQTVKTLLKSQNSAIMYQTLKAYNKFYRMRDFVFVRHAFSHNGNVYLVDKSIDNINFPPFMTLVRGEISALWGIFKNQANKQITLTGEFSIVNAGLLNSQQETNLSLKYLNGFKELLKIKADIGMESSMFDVDWNIDQKVENKHFDDIRVRRRTIQVQKDKLNGKQNKIQQNESISFNKKSSSYYQGQSSPQRNDKSQRIQIQLDSSPEKSYTKEINSPIKSSNKIVLVNINTAIPYDQPKITILRKLDEKGYIIIDKQYIKRKYPLNPVKKQSYIECQLVKGHAIWKGDWIRDVKTGGLIFINHKKIEEQKGVLKFVLTKIGKNILSGKSVLDISLPVDILSTESNLQKLIMSMAYGPKLLQNLHQKTLIQKLAQVISFGISNSVLYINLDKPFNPILGETFQCWINGCPAYGEQISHHPPIAALMFFGRGYQVTCQLQSKVQLHMNSGSGANEGIFKVLFDDGTQIFFTSPESEISGLSYGDRRYNLIGKSYYWSERERIFIQLNFDAGKKGLFSKNDKPCDYFEGKVYEVIPDFFKTFPKMKKKEPSDKEKVKELGTFEGVWNKYVKFNGKEIFNFDQMVPLRLEYESHPLASDSNWREDIEYRRLNKVTRAQTEKERLQVIQRTDRKFRQKYLKK